jgi:hypothetical protein
MANTRTISQLETEGFPWIGCECPLQRVLSSVVNSIWPLEDRSDDGVIAGACK